LTLCTKVRFGSADGLVRLFMFNHDAAFRPIALQRLFDVTDVRLRES
jgi:hypothetical protein